MEEKGDQILWTDTLSSGDGQKMGRSVDWGRDERKMRREGEEEKKVRERERERESKRGC